jgi:hypothetical protein
VGCTTHQSEILVRPQHGAAMIRNFPAINGIASICSFSSSYWYWKNVYFLILFSALSILSFFICLILHFLHLRSDILYIYLIPALSFLSAANLQVFFISLSLCVLFLTTLFYISSFFYFLCRVSSFPISSFLNPCFYLNPGRHNSFLSLLLWPL